MFRRLVSKKSISIMSAILISSSFMVGFSPNPAKEPKLASYEKFLKDNYKILLKDEVSQKQFVDSVSTVLKEVPVFPEEIDAEGFTIQELVLTSLYYANLDELAYTYPKEKVENALKGWENIPEDLDFARKQEFAAAIDTGLMDESLKGIKITDNVASNIATNMLGKILEVQGKYKNFLGNSSDYDIYNKVLHSWDSFDTVLMPELQAKANELIRQEFITGYNIKKEAQKSLADLDKTLVYGHSDISHAIQLIGLLRSEDIVANIQLELRTSVYTYLLEWGEPDLIGTPEYRVVDAGDDLYMVNAKEYDLVMEFENKEDKARFDSMITKYAKKDEANEENLIISSWWQPLYTSNEPMESFQPIKNNIVSNGTTYIQTFSLLENSQGILEKLEADFPGFEVNTIDLWVNQPFYNYLLGEYK